MRRPVVVLHSFGEVGSGGPIVSVNRVFKSGLAEKYEFLRMHQKAPAGGVDLRLLHQWASLLRRARPDLVHVVGLGNEGFHAVLAAKIAGCSRILVTIHGTARDLTVGKSALRRKVVVRALEPLTLSMATHVATVCEFAAGRQFLAPYRAKMVGVLPNGVDVGAEDRGAREAMRRELGVGDGDVVGVVVGRLSVEKGHLVLADALRQVQLQDLPFRLLLVGDGPDRELLERTYSSVEGLDYSFLGQRLDVAEILQASDVFLFPTLHENLSNALLEGMATGLAIVASAVGGNIEVLERGGGVLVPASDAVALGSEIACVVRDGDTRARYGRDARAVVQSHYTVGQMIQAVDRVYEGILAGGAHR